MLGAFIDEIPLPGVAVFRGDYLMLATYNRVFNIGKSLPRPGRQGRSDGFKDFGRAIVLVVHRAVGGVNSDSHGEGDCQKGSHVPLGNMIKDDRLGFSRIFHGVNISASRAGHKWVENQTIPSPLTKMEPRKCV